jgi:hypothetical protein
MQAVVRKLVRRDVTSDLAGLRSLGQQVTDHLDEMLTGSGEVLIAMQERRQFAVLMRAGLVGDEGVRLQHRFESFAGAVGLVADLGELFEVAGDLTFVPGEQDRLDVLEVLVQRRRPMPASSAICDIVTDRSPCSATSAAVVRRTASRTSLR